MILYIDQSRKIIAYNDTLSPEEEASENLDQFSVRYSGEFSFLMGDNIKNTEKVFYLNSDNTVSIEYVPCEIRFTPDEKIMQALTDSELRDLKAETGRQLLAQKLTDIELRLLGGSAV